MRELRFLILEDDPHKTRMKAFRNRFAELYDSGKARIQYDHVEHAKDCIEKLKQNEYDLILLDHDLGGKEMVDTGHEDCGSRVADFLLENPDVRKKHGGIIIHSSNSVAGPLMAKRLGCTWAPGVYLEQEWYRIIRIG